MNTRRLPLTDRGVQALEHFAELGCWGKLSNSSMIKCFHRACDAVGVPRMRAYELRHSFATELYRQTGNPKATAAMAMPSERSHMMDRFTIGGVELRLQLATKAFNAVVPTRVVAENRGSKLETSEKTASTLKAPVAQQDRASVS